MTSCPWNFVLYISFQIDWNRIIVNGKLYVGNNSTNLMNCTWLMFEHCKSCKEINRCWNSKACQRFESSFLPDKRQKTKAICHPLCLGDCVNPLASGCYTCKDISEDSKCVEKCSESKWVSLKHNRIQFLLLFSKGIWMLTRDVA